MIYTLDIVDDNFVNYHMKSVSVRSWVTEQLLPDCRQFAECPFREKKVGGDVNYKSETSDIYYFMHGWYRTISKMLHLCSR